MKQPIPINPSVLQWARETAGLQIDEVVQKLKRKRITRQTIEAWEKGEETPTYIELENLAYNVYKRPIALFFFPNPPEEETPKQSFRTLPGEEIDALTSRAHYLLKQAKALQINLQELYDNVNPTDRQILHDIKFLPDTHITQAVNIVRDYLTISLDIQFSWKSEDEAFKAWRSALENCGIFVFKEAFQEDTISGFCFFDQEFPIIYINNSMPCTRQIFTLFHELAHLLFRIGGIDKRNDDYINYLHGDDRKIETFCNQFAGAFLVPDDDFENRVNEINTENDIQITKLSHLYRVSREVILRKLFDRKIVNQQQYRSMVEDWNNKSSNKGGSGGNYYLNKGVYLGTAYIEKVFQKMYQNRISMEQASEYLGVKATNMPKMEQWLYQRKAAT